MGTGVTFGSGVAPKTTAEKTPAANVIRIVEVIRSNSIESFVLRNIAHIVHDVLKNTYTSRNPHILNRKSLLPSPSKTQ